MIAQVLVRPGDSPRMPQADYRQCEHSIWKRDGFRVLPRRGRVQRWQCVACGCVQLEGRHTIDKVAIGRALLMPGASVNEIARITGHSREVVRQVARMLAGLRPPCGCGKPAGHEGRRLRNCSKV